MSLLAHSIKYLGAGGGSSNAMDTTGANLIVIAISSYVPAGPGALTDSLGNTWNVLTPAGSTNVQVYMYYVFAPTVGAAHTFSTTANFSTISVMAFSGALTSPLDAQNHNVVTAASNQVGSVNPGSANEWIITAIGVAAAVTTFGIDQSLTVLDHLDYNAGTAFGLAVATLQEGTATPKNPTWSLGASVETAAVIATFKASAPAPPSAPTIAPWGGYNGSSVSVTLSSGSGSIYYTTDGSTPTTASTLYTTPISVSAGTTLKAIADNGSSSGVSTAVFHPGLIYPAVAWPNVTDGNNIEVTDGCVMWDAASSHYYWYGCNRFQHNAADNTSIGCFKSTDLLNWVWVGNVLPPRDATRTQERPTVVFNVSTSKYVMWLHEDVNTYTNAQVRIATADNPEGPWTHFGIVKPGGHDSRDCKLFLDDDGVCYFYSTDNTNLYCYTLDSAYTSVVTTTDTGIGAREAPAVWRIGSTYYMMNSGLTGWTPNTNKCYTSASPQGPWTDRGNPFQPSGSQDNTTAYTAQTSHVFKVQAANRWVWYGNRYFEFDLQNSLTLMLPMVINGTSVSISWADSWDPTFPAPSGVLKFLRDSSMSGGLQTIGS